MQSTTWSGPRRSLLITAGLMVLFALVLVLVLAVAAPARADSLEQPTLTITAIPSVVDWAGQWELIGHLMTSADAPIPDAAVDLQSSIDGGLTWATLQNVPWDAGSSTYEAFIGAPYQRMLFRLKYDGDGVTYAGAISEPITVAPRVKLGTPVAPSSAWQGTRFTVYGSLRPQQPRNSKTVKIRCSFLQNGKWVLKKSVSATNTNRGSATTRYTATFSLPSGGSWKLVAYAPATAMYARTTSGAEGVTVK